MCVPKSKKQLLEEAGYKYNFDLEIYFNKQFKKIFSLNAIDDHDEAWLVDRLAETTKNEWKFYFNEPPSEKIEKNILSELNEK